MSDFKFTKSDFIFEKGANFREQYQIGAQMGVGAFGEVRKCINRKTGAIRAVKVMKKDALDGKDKLRFFYEIEILKMLDHPNILKLYEIF